MTTFGAPAGGRGVGGQYGSASQWYGAMVPSNSCASTAATVTAEVTRMSDQRHDGVMERAAPTSIGIDDDHLALRDTVRRWALGNEPLKHARAMLDADDETLPGWWPDLAELGWLGLHLPEGDGGSGYGTLELAVVLEELGRWCAPGPFLPTVIASSAIDRFCTGGRARELLPALADGSACAGVGIGCAPWSPATTTVQWWSTAPGSRCSAPPSPRCSCCP